MDTTRCVFFHIRAHLETAAEMLSKVRTVQQEAGEEFAFEDQVSKTNQHTALSGNDLLS